MNKAIKRELEVAFAKNAQPIWLRILKYLLLAALIYFLWGTQLLWIVLAILFVGGFSVHFWYRHKTKGWTKSYGAWDVEKNKPE